MLLYHSSVRCYYTPTVVLGVIISPTVVLGVIISPDSSVRCYYITDRQ